MNGIGLLQLVLVSMGWFAFLAGLALRLRLLPGIVGSLAVFFTLPMLAMRGIPVPWPWLWILLPLALEARWLVGPRIRRSKDGSS